MNKIRLEFENVTEQELLQAAIVGMEWTQLELANRIAGIKDHLDGNTGYGGLETATAVAPKRGKKGKRGSHAGYKRGPMSDKVKAKIRKAQKAIWKKRKAGK